ncbi:MAG: hypothetical protein WAQ53_14790 [Thiofilum sp.]|uniref:hypothetical protein n=1 Tax=Thiofilum sp. TaxID=2212733 RepID=UPI0025E54060|nr:hypothetical protein [Thiofilum sp.]MBK8453521.1 hypothetical protein [Thiofilum sp.]
MFNPTYSQQLQASIEQAINDLMAQSRANTHSILERQTRIQQFKQDINSLVAPASEGEVEAADSPATLEQARATAVQQDCQTLVTSIDTISDHISQKNTKAALDLIQPLLTRGQLLNARVHYVYELELLLNDFEQEKQVRSRLQKIAAALDLPVSALTPATPVTETPVAESQVTETSVAEASATADSVETDTGTTAPNVASATAPATLEESENVSTDLVVDDTTSEDAPEAAYVATMDETVEEPTVAEVEAQPLSESTLPELEALLKIEPKTPINDTPIEKLDFNKFGTTDISSQAKHLDFMLNPPSSFDLDEEVLSGKSLQDDLDTLLMEAELLEKQANLKKALSEPETSLFSTKYPFK